MRDHCFAIGCLLLAGLIGGYAWTRVPENTVITTGKALVGGPFRLTNQHGQPVQDSDFRGKYMLVVFGYSFCPDVCPAELQVVTAALEAMGPEADRIQPIFITVDPERDTVSQLAVYSQNFHPRLLALTGTPAEIAEVAGRYRVYYAKAAGSSSSQDYLMDHSSIIYLMGPDGQFVQHFPYSTDAAKLAEQLRAAIAR